MKDLLKKSGWVDILLSVLFAVIGIFMIVKADLAVKIISYVLGGLFIAIGLVKCVDYFVSKGKNDFYNYDFIYGIIAIIIGLVTIFCSNLIESMFRIVMKLRRAEIKMWSVSLILSIIMLIGGVYIIFQSGAIVSTIGVIVLIYAIMDLIENIMFVKNVDELL